MGGCVRFIKHCGWYLLGVRVYFRNAKSPIRIIYVFSQGASLLQIPIFVTVWDFVLDDMRSVKTHFSLSEDPETAFHNGTYDWCSGTQTCHDAHRDCF